MPSETPRVESFVLRFVSEEPGDSTAAQVHARPNSLNSARWRGTVVHVQTNQEKNFTKIADAIAFISRYVPVGDFASENAASHGEASDGELPSGNHPQDGATE